MTPIFDKAISQVIITGIVVAYAGPAVVGTVGFLGEKVCLEGVKTIKDSDEFLDKLAKRALTAFAAVGAFFATVGAGAFATTVSGTALLIGAAWISPLSSIVLPFAIGTGVGVALATIPYHKRAFEEAL